MARVFHAFDPMRVPGIRFDESEGKTHQEFKEECDINVIMRKALTTGLFPPGVNVGRYGDFSDVGDFQESQERIKVAEAQFKGLPADVRDKFRNDPARFLEWILDKKNLDEAQTLGLLSDEAVKRRDSEKAAAAAVKEAEVKPPA